MNDAMKYFTIILGLTVTISAFAEGLLYVGDSHSYIREENPAADARRFGNVFTEGMKDRGLEITYYAACGSAPIDWVAGSRTECGFTSIVEGKLTSIVKSSFPSLKTIYSPEKHQKIVINLGDNMFDWQVVAGKRVARFNPGSFANSMTKFLAILTSAAPENCSWVGPTYHIEGSTYRKEDSVVDEFYRALEDKLSGVCTVIDSRPLVRPVVPNDGLHHVNADSQKWAEGVLNLI